MAGIFSVEFFNGVSRSIASPVVFFSYLGPTFLRFIPNYIFPVFTGTYSVMF